jgi:tetratricopeptide (TPR) repeat protein
MRQPLLILVLTLGLAAALPAQKPQPGPAAGKHPPQAKTQAEYKDYNTAFATSGGEAMEKAADAFAVKYPDSELRAILYSQAMRQYQQENNSGKMLAMGEKVLTLDPDNTVALVLTATVMSDDLTESDSGQAGSSPSGDEKERDKKIAEIRKNSSRALETVDSGFASPAGATPEQITAYKNRLRSMAHSALGITNLKTGDNPGAEKEFKMAAELIQAEPDPFVFYHLALAQDHQGKYAEALASVDQALKSAGSAPDLAKLASGERERLVKLADTNTSTSPSQAPAQPSPARPPQ